LKLTELIELFKNIIFIPKNYGESETWVVGGEKALIYISR